MWGKKKHEIKTNGKRFNNRAVIADEKAKMHFYTRPRNRRIRRRLGLERLFVFAINTRPLPRQCATRVRCAMSAGRFRSHFASHFRLIDYYLRLFRQT